MNGTMDGDLPDAEERRVWESLIQSDPASPALLRLAKGYLKDGQPAKSLEVARPILAAHAYHLEAAVVVTRALLDLSRVAEARQILAQAGRGLDRLSAALTELAPLVEEAGDPRGGTRLRHAAQILRGGAEDGDRAEESGDAVPTETLASLYLAQGHRDKAVEVYEKLARAQPENARYAERLAELRAEAEPAPLPMENLWADQAAGEDAGVEAEDVDGAETAAATRREATRKLAVARLEKIKTAARARRQAVQGPADSL